LSQLVFNYKLPNYPSLLLSLAVLLAEELVEVGIVHAVAVYFAHAQVQADALHLLYLVVDQLHLCGEAALDELVPGGEALVGRDILFFEAELDLEPLVILLELVGGRDFVAVHQPFELLVLVLELLIGHVGALPNNTAVAIKQRNV